MPQHEIDVILGAVGELRKEMTQRMDRLDDKFDRLYANGCAKSSQHEDIESRMRSIEIERAKLMGIATAISILVTIAGWVISTFIK